MVKKTAECICWMYLTKKNSLIIFSLHVLKRFLNIMFRHTSDNKNYWWKGRNCFLYHVLNSLQLDLVENSNNCLGNIMADIWIFLSICPSINQSIHLSMYQLINQYLLIYQPTLSICLSISLFFYVSFSLPVYLYIYVCLSACLLLC